jgi:hypothetical protein
MVQSGRALRRVWRHVTRTQARFGWTLAAFSILVYATYPDSWASGDAVREFTVVLSSVALGAVFLPELSSNLWTIKPSEVRGLIPEDRIKSLESSLIEAQIDESEWAKSILHGALRPLLKVGAERHKVLADTLYSVNIHPDERIVLNGRDYRVHRVETSLRARRVLPPDVGGEFYWISVARDNASLAAEFQQDSCLLREVVALSPELTPDEWREAALAMSSARIVVDGATVEATTEVPSSVSAGQPQNVVRWYFPASELAGEHRQDRRMMTLALDYPTEINRISVVFGAYYNMGSLQVIFRIYDMKAQYEIFHEAFLARALGSGEIDVSATRKPDLCHQISVISSDDTLVWPGSGIAIWWERC